MFVWTGILLEDQLNELKDKARKIEGDLKFPLSCHELPSHISLKISFFVEDDKFDKVVEELTNLYHHLLPFTVECDGIQKEGQIVWLRMKENVLLKCAQISVNSLLERRFNVPLHPYDCDFKFHSTLFMDNDKERIDSAYELIKDQTFPKNLSVNKFIIGKSNTGELGTFSIHKQITI